MEGARVSKKLESKNPSAEVLEYSEQLEAETLKAVKALHRALNRLRFLESTELPDAETHGKLEEAGQQHHATHLACSACNLHLPREQNYGTVKAALEGFEWPLMD